MAFQGHRFASALVFAVVLACGSSAAALELTSTAFKNGAPIPEKYTCDANDLSPPLVWSGAPVRTLSYALVMDDPDAPMKTWVHWVVWNIPGTAGGLREGIETKSSIDGGIQQGLSDFGKPGYGSPCPPAGVHHYYFRLYALDTFLELPPKASRADLEAAMKDHIAAQAQLMGIYKRSSVVTPYTR